MVDSDENGDETQKPTEWQGAGVKALLPRSGLVRAPSTKQSPEVKVL